MLFLLLQTPAIQLEVDATQAPRNIVRIKETIPIKGGQIALRYPKWIPGEHQPSGPINNMIRLEVRAGGKVVPWTRDWQDLWSFKIDAPKDAKELEVMATFAEEAGDVFTNNLGRIKWNRYILLPTGPIDKIMVRPRLVLPSGWSAHTALIPDGMGYQTISAERLVDSPAQIGRNAKSIDLGDSHYLDVITDEAAQLDIKQGTIDSFKRLILEANAIAGARHYRQYRFLCTFSNYGAYDGLEHHESSEDGMSASSLTDENGLAGIGGLVSHEMFHSWNGKYRRPKGLCTPDFATAQDTELLWVYEGLTQYYGEVLTPRAGFSTQEQARESLATVAADFSVRTGRVWRPVADTATSVWLGRNAPRPWSQDRRRTDYYSESQLVWLEVDSIIRRMSANSRSLDDFVKRFHGGKSGGPEVAPYTFDDVVTNLNAVAGYDWRSLLRERIYGVQPAPPVNGIEASGWRLVYTDQPQKGGANERRYDLGVSLDKDGVVSDLSMGMPSEAAGLTPGMKITAVNGKVFSPEALNAEVVAKIPLKLTVSKENQVINLEIGYTGGPKYPHLVKVDGKDDFLTSILSPRIK